MRRAAVILALLSGAACRTASPPPPKTALASKAKKAPPRTGRASQYVCRDQSKAFGLAGAGPALLRLSRREGLVRLGFGCFDETWAPLDVTGPALEESFSWIGAFPASPEGLAAPAGAACEITVGEDEAECDPRDRMALVPGTAAEELVLFLESRLASCVVERYAYSCRPGRRPPP